MAKEGMPGIECQEWQEILRKINARANLINGARNCEQRRQGTCQEIPLPPRVPPTQPRGNTATLRPSHYTSPLLHLQQLLAPGTLWGLWVSGLIQAAEGKKVGG